MRTTLDLPDALLRRAKIAAVERGTTLRELVSAALSKELGLPPEGPSAQRRATFPIFGSVSPGSLNLSGADLDEAEAQEDKSRHGLVG